MLAVVGDLTTAEVLRVYFMCCGVCLALEMCIFTLFAGTAGLDPLCLLMLLSKRELHKFIPGCDKPGNVNTNKMFSRCSY